MEPIQNPFELILKKLNGIENQIRQLQTNKATTAADDFLTVEQAAAFLNLEKSTVYKKVSDGKLPFYKAGKKLFFKRAELVKIVELGKVDAV